MHRSRLILTAAVIGGLAVACKDGGGDRAAGSSERAASRARPAATGPAGKVYAASAHLRAVDVATGAVTGRIDLSRAVTSFAFTADGKRAFFSASDGVYALDPATDVVLGKLTDHPARRLFVDDAARRLWVLEHEVVVQDDGTREILPFRMVGLELDTGKVVSDEEIGQRIQFALPAAGERSHHVAIGESGEVTIGRGAFLDGEVLPLGDELSREGPFRVRGEAAVVAGAHLYFPIESARSRIAELDLGSGRLSFIDLERPLQLRALAISADRRTLYVNASEELIVVDLASRAPRAAIELDGAHLGLSLSGDGAFAFLAQTIHEVPSPGGAARTGGAVTVVALGALEVRAKHHLDDITPWALGALPSPSGLKSR